MKLSITTFFMCFTFISFAQSSYNISQLQSFLLKEASNLRSTNIDKNSENIEGSPFLTEDFVEGDVYTNSGSFKGVKMKYDRQEGVFLFNLNNQLQYLDPLPSVLKVVYDKQSFVVRKYSIKSKANIGYVVRLDSGKVSLYAKKNVYFRPAEPPKALESASHPAKFTSAPDNYFLQFGNGSLVLFDGVKDIYELFPDLAESLKVYIKKEKLSTKKESDLIAITQFCSKSL